MTNQEIFYKAVDALDITEIQKIDVKILGIDYALKEYLRGIEMQSNETLSTFGSN